MEKNFCHTKTFKQIVHRIKIYLFFLRQNVIKLSNADLIKKYLIPFHRDEEEYQKYRQN